MGPVADPQIDNSGSTSEIATLLAAAADGQEAAWREIIHRYGRRVFALVKSRCVQVELAEEITQSVFATLAAKLRTGGYAEKGRFESWLFRVTMNRVRDEMRRRRRHTESLDDGNHPLPVAAERGPEMSGMLGRLREAVAQLSEQDREVVELRHHAGLSFKEMSELLEEPLGTLLARHHRALKKLKQLIGDEDEQ
jgi:RNA polymerase sigma-70 factor, ECF subfamily